MTAEKYLVCTECKSYVYVCKNGRLESRPQEMNDIAAFIEDHEYNCEGNMSVWDESCMPPSEPKSDGGIYERIWPYKSYTGRGRKP
jgi:hypothetical protein